MKLRRATMIVFAVFLLAGCGTVSGTTRNGKSSNTLPLLSEPTVLYVVRPARSDYPGFNRTIRNAQAVQRLYRAAYALPLPPSSGVTHCGSDNGMFYILTFVDEKTHQQQQMRQYAEGCQNLDLNLQGPSGARLTNDAFLSLLLKTIGIPSLVPGVEIGQQVQ